MIRVGINELPQHASRYLARVKAGETIEVTKRGRLVALLTPPSPASSTRERMIREGRLIPATLPFELPTPVPKPPGSPSISEVLDELREERLP